MGGRSIWKLAIVTLAGCCVVGAAVLLLAGRRGSPAVIPAASSGSSSVKSVVRLGLTVYKLDPGDRFAIDVSLGSGAPHRHSLCGDTSTLDRICSINDYSLALGYDPSPNTTAAYKFERIHQDGQVDVFDQGDVSLNADTEVTAIYPALGYR